MIIIIIIMNSTSVLNYYFYTTGSSARIAIGIGSASWIAGKVYSFLVIFIIITIFLNSLIKCVNNYPHWRFFLTTGSRRRLSTTCTRVLLKSEDWFWRFICSASFIFGPPVNTQRWWSFWVAVEHISMSVVYYLLVQIQCYTILFKSINWLVDQLTIKNF